MTIIKRLIISALLIAVFGCMNLVAEPTKSDQEQTHEMLHEEIKSSLSLKEVIEHKFKKAKESRIKDIKMYSMGFLAAATLIHNTREDFRTDSWAKKLAYTGLGLIAGYAAGDAINNGQTTLWSLQTVPALSLLAAEALAPKIPALNLKLSVFSCGAALITGLFLNELKRRTLIAQEKRKTQNQKKRESAPEKEEAQDSALDTEIK